jgi:hypothetical protein
VLRWLDGRPAFRLHHSQLVADATRRAFLGYFAYAGIAPSLFPAALLARIRPGTAVIEVATIREAARLAGMNWTDAECREVAGALSSGGGNQQ